MGRVREIVKKLVVEWSGYSPKFIIKRNLPFTYKEDKANIVTGPRRVGKTYFMFQLMKNFDVENCFYINFEDDRIFPLSLMDMESLIQAYYELFPQKKR